MSGERRSVERRHLPEGLRPRIRVVLVVDAAIVDELLPHETGADIRDRPVAVVDVAAREPALQLAVLAGASAGDRDTGGVRAGRLPRLLELPRRRRLACRQVAIAR